MSEKDNTDNKNLFDDLGLSLEFAEVQVGQTYPIYGSITKFINDELGNVIIEINQSIEATLNIQDEDKLNILKNRTFDVGIFVCVVKEITPKIKVECSTVIFGKNNEQVQ